jgi:hypothetical protein
LCTIYSSIYAQNYSIGIHGGITQSFFNVKLNGIESSSNKLGYTLGFEFQRKLTNNLFLVIAPSYQNFKIEYSSKSINLNDPKTYFVEDQFNSFYLPLFIRLKHGNDFKIISDFGLGIHSTKFDTRDVSPNIKIDSIPLKNKVLLYELDIPDIIVGIGFEKEFAKHNSISFLFKGQFVFKNFIENTYNSNNDKIFGNIFSLNIAYRYYFFFNRSKYK